MLRMCGNMNENKREYLYDYLRLIATIFVVIGHSVYLKISTTYGGVTYIIPDDVSNIYYLPFAETIKFIASWVYGFHMPLFFIMSGAVLALKPIPAFDKFFKSKFKRLLIPYFVYGILYMLPVKYLAGFYDASGFKKAMTGFLSGQDSGHLWFLPALFWCMLLFILIKTVVSYFSKSNYVLLIISGIVIFLYSYIPFDILQMKKGFSYIFYFTLGYVIENERRENKPWNIRKTLGAIIILLALEIVHTKYHNLNNLFVVLVGSFLTLLIAYLCSKIFSNHSESKLFNIVTRNLFYVYIFHDPLNYVILKLFIPNNLISSNFGCIMYFVCRTLGVFIVSILMGEIITVIKKLFTALIFTDNSPGKLSIKQIAAIVVILIGLIAGISTPYLIMNNKIHASDLTNDNWTNGIKNSDTSCILFLNTDANHKKISDAEKLICNNEEYNIVEFESDATWIRIKVDKDATPCAYPNELIFK